MFLTAQTGPRFLIDVSKKNNVERNYVPNVVTHTPNVTSVQTDGQNDVLLKIL